MPKRAVKETQVLMQQAFQLLDRGFSKEEVAAKLNTTLRTIQRWIKHGNYQKPEDRAQTALVEIAEKTTVEAIETIPEQDLADYHSSQRWLAVEMGGLAARLLPLLKDCLDGVTPGDITPRMLPSLLKTVSELAQSSSDCWSRATGLEEVLSVIKQQIEESREFEAE